MRRFSMSAVNYADSLISGLPKAEQLKPIKGLLSLSNGDKSFYAAQALASGKVDKDFHLSLAQACRFNDARAVLGADINLCSKAQKQLLELFHQKNVIGFIADNQISTQNLPSAIAYILGNPFKNLIVDPEAGLPEGTKPEDLYDVKAIISNNAHAALRGANISEDLQRQLIDNLSYHDAKNINVGLGQLNLAWDNRQYFVDHAVKELLTKDYRDDVVVRECQEFIEKTDFTIYEVEKAFTNLERGADWAKLQDQVKEGLASGKGFNVW